MKLEDVAMEDINSMMIALFDKMEGLGISLPPDREDVLFEKISAVLEETFRWPDYRNHN
jgi:hypothetical protein